MERMRVALEKARREREAIRTGAELPTMPSPPAASSPAPGSMSVGSAGDLEFETSRVVTLSPQVLKENRIVLGSNYQEFADLYRMLRSQVQVRLAGSNRTTLAITSAVAGEGKTHTAINLAISLAKDMNHTVLLVDLDLRRSSIHRFLGFRPEAGVTDILTGDAKLSDALVNPGVERLLILPNRTSLSDSSEVLKSPRMVELAARFAALGPEWFVVYDMPPVLVSDDCISFLRHVDACLLVVEEGKSSAADVARAAELLQDHNLIGAVLNKASPVNDGSGYYYQYAAGYAPRNDESVE